MKKLLIVTSCVFSIMTTPLNAQEQLTPEKKARHEINLGIAGLLSRIIPIYNVWETSQYIYQNPDFGFGYKYHLSNLAVRLNFDLGLKNDNFQSDFYFFDNKYFNSTTKLGFQYENAIEKVIVFYGFNLIWGYSETKSETIYTIDNPWVLNSKSFIWQKTYGISPLIGIKYQINKLISLSSEASLDVSYFENKTNYYYSTDNSISSGSGLELDVNPIGLLSVNIHL